jgi:ribonuclease HI
LKLVAHFDGSCGPTNPGGTARYGYVIRRDHELIHRASGVVGTGAGMTNNVAEASGALELMRYLLDRCSYATEVWIYGDSSIVINKLRGPRSSKQPKGCYAPLMTEAQAVAAQLSKRHPTYFQWIPREQNTEADELSNGFYRPDRAVVSDLRNHREYGQPEFRAAKEPSGSTNLDEELRRRLERES